MKLIFNETKFLINANKPYIEVILFVLKLDKSKVIKDEMSTYKTYFLN